MGLRDQTTELYFSFTQTKEVNNVFKTTGLVKYLQFLKIKPILEDLLIICNKCFLKEGEESVSDTIHLNHQYHKHP